MEIHRRILENVEDSIKDEIGGMNKTYHVAARMYGLW
jgi:hypothetical protein